MNLPRAPVDPRQSLQVVLSGRSALRPTRYLLRRADARMGTMMRLENTEVRLWFVFCREIQDEALLARYRTLLSEVERQQERRFYFPQDRHRYLLTRALVRTVLSRYLPVLPQDWQFAADEHGRPHIVNSVPGVDDLSFNISHTREIVMLGVTKRSALGVDVEGANADTATVALADRYFSVAEAASLRALPQAAQSERFFDYWTLKESYIKARGLGLALPLQGFGFRSEERR